MKTVNKKQYTAPAARLIALRHQALLMAGSPVRLQAKRRYDDDNESEDETERTIYNLGW